MCPYDSGNIIWPLEAFIYIPIKCSLCNTCLFDPFYVKLVVQEPTSPTKLSISLTVFYDDQKN